MNEYRVETVEMGSGVQIEGSKSGYRGGSQRGRRRGMAARVDLHRSTQSPGRLDHVHVLRAQ
jgi:hypothetical protein